MLTSLSGWKRLGMVVSALWFVGAYVGYGAHAVHKHQEIVTAAYAACMTSRKPDVEKCGREFDRDYPIFNQISRTQRFVFAAVPLLILWLFALLATPTARWLRRGFQSTP